MAPVYPDLPPFPDDVPTAPLVKISFLALAAGDPDETARLFAAAKDTGFFYLDLRRTPDGEFILEDVNEMLSLAAKLGDIDDEEREYLRSTLTKETLFGTALVPRALRFEVRKI
jgi:hypothetical protein